MTEYTYTDRHGEKLKVERSSFATEEAFLLSEGGGVFVPAADLPKIVAELYEAAGQQPPILLPRPTISDLDGWIDGQRVNVDAIRTAGLVTPGRARGLAACLAASADIAEAEPTPEQVKQLIEVIQDGGATTRGFAQMIARAVLAAGYTRSDS